MNKKWFLMLVSLFLSTMVVVGCNNDEGDPAPPQENTTEDDPSVEDPLEKANDLGEDAEQRSDAEENRDEKTEENFEESVDDLEEDPDTNTEK